MKRLQATCQRPEYRRGKKGRIRKVLASGISAVALGALAMNAQTGGLIARTQVVGGNGAGACPVLLINFTQELSLAAQSQAAGANALTVRLQSAGNTPLQGVAPELIETQPGIEIPGLGTVFVSVDNSGSQPVLTVRLPDSQTEAVATQSGAMSIIVALQPVSGSCLTDSTGTDAADAAAPDTAELPVADLPPEALPADPANATSVDTEAAALLADARAAIIAQELDRAVQLLTDLQGMPANASSAEAQELLGVVRERNGQLAHAKAEYEIYLAKYPDGPGAERGAPAAGGD